MRSISKIIILLVAGLCLATCSTQKTSEAGKPTGVAAATDLPLPQVPDLLTDPGARASYHALHFWDIGRE